MAELLTGSAVAAIATSCLVWIWIRISVRAKILDFPTQRSSHATATPRGGGVGIVTVVVVSLFLGPIILETGPSSTSFAWAAGLSLAVATVGFIDDIRSLSSVLRLVLQVIIAGTAVWKLGEFNLLTLPFAEPISLPISVGRCLTVVWIVGMINVYNFMDGIDGIAGVQGIAAGFAWVLFGNLFNCPTVMWIGGILVASCIGFLVHNWSPAKIFMGDVGSAFLGFMFAVLPILAPADQSSTGWSQEILGSVPMFAVLSVWPFVGDGVFTFFRRLLLRENVLTAHRSHLYQRLTVAGWLHAPVSLLYALWAVLSAAFAVVYVLGTGTMMAVISVLNVASILAMVALVRRLEARTVNHPHSQPGSQSQTVGSGERSAN